VRKRRKASRICYLSNFFKKKLSLIKRMWKQWTQFLRRIIILRIVLESFFQKCVRLSW
jgi:hypothetical protein